MDRYLVARVLITGPPHLSISLFDGLEQLGKAWGLMDRPQTMRASAKHLHIPLGQKADCYYPITVHSPVTSPNAESAN